MASQSLTLKSDFRTGSSLRSIALLSIFAALAGCVQIAAPATAPAPAPAPAPDVLPPGDFVLLGEEIAPVSTDLLGGASYDLPVVANSWVETELRFLVEDRRETVNRWMDRGDFYKPYIQNVLAEAGLPRDLYHLAMIESGFIPTARSHAGAVGMWQFMPATAGDVGLRIDDMVDERMDPVRATRAAAAHLRSLYRIHQDWPLAIAAYNAGSGRIRRGLSEFGATDFWDLARRGDLAEETRQYVPRLFAVTIAGHDRERFGLESPARVAPFAFDSVYLDQAIGLADFARVAEVAPESLTDLNPHLLRGIAPGGYWLWVPQGYGERMQRSYIAYQRQLASGLVAYELQFGDNVPMLARLGGVSTNSIQTWNPEVNLNRLEGGDTLQLPETAVRRIRRAMAPPPPVVGDPVPTAEPETRPQPAVHVVTSGETLSRIALDYGVSVSAIREANSLSGDVIRIGQRLTIPGGGQPAAAAVVEYVVEPGDTLWAIARQYGSTIAAISDANGLGSRPIQPGQVLTIPR